MFTDKRVLLGDLPVMQTVSYFIFICSILFAAGNTVNADETSECGQACLFKRAERFLPEKFLSEFPELSRRALSVNWAADSKKLWLTAPSENGIILRVADVDSQSVRKIVTASDLASLLQLDHTIEADPLAIKFRAAAYDDKNRELGFVYAGVKYTYDVMSQKVRQKQLQPRTAESISPNGNYAVFTKDDDLYIRAGGSTKRLTSDGSKWHSFAGHMANSNPHDYEFKRPVPPRVKWIGTSSRFYIERWDNRAVGEVWHINYLAEGRPELVTQKFAYAGEDNLPVQELWVFDAEEASGFQVDTAGWDHIGNMDIDNGGIFPAKDGGSLYFARMSRGYNIVELCKLDVKTGSIQVVLREEGEKPSGVRSVEFYELATGFIWKSDRDDFNHYYLYDHNGKMVRQLTNGNYSVRNIVQVNESRGRLYYMAYGDASKENPYYRYTYSVDLSGENQKRLDTVPAVHRVSMSPDGGHYVDTYGRVDLAPQMVLKDSKGKAIMTLASINTDKLMATGWHKPKRFEVKTADQTTSLFGVMWLPINFDKNKSYPVISHVYPGPQGETPPFGSFTPQHRNAALAELGFVVVASGHRGGASNRGKAYQQYNMTVGNMRDYALADSKYVLKQLGKKYAFMDLSRVGVYGHSGGGFMSASAILKYPDFYKAAVSGAGNHDNNIYEMNSGEFYFGHPITGPAGGPDGYATTMELAGQLKGKLLLIQGDLDQDVHIAHTMRLLRAFIEAGKKVDIALLPGEGHAGFSGPADDYYRLRLWDYFLEHLANHKSVSVDLGVK